MNSLNLSDVNKNRLVMSEKKLPHKDQRFIEGLKQNDRLIIEETKTKYYVKLEQFVLKNSGNKSDANDLFQDALIAVWEKVKTKDVILTVPFGGYFYRVYRNMWYNILRNRNGKNKPKLEDLEEYKHIITDYEEENDKEKILTLLEECWKNLGSDCKKILKLKYDDGMKAKEIMKELNKPSTNSVHQAMFICKKELKKCMELHPDFDKLDF